MNQYIQLIAVIGPTGVGKTEIGIKLAEELKTEIISCDSMQIYRYMDIGTAKPTFEQQTRVKHHLIDIVNPDESYDAAYYRSQGMEAAKGLHKEGKVPIVVGGTGFYLRALIDGLFEQAKIPKEFREKMENQWREHPSLQIHEALQKVDPKAAERIHPNDRKRLLRALEVYEYTGKPISYWHEEQQKEASPYKPIIIGLDVPREELYSRINQRVLDMFKRGWVEEVKELRKRGYSTKLLPMQSLGYKYINQYLDGDCTEKDMVKNTQQDTRHYAKRQFTWFRADTRIEWININGVKTTDVLKTIKDIITRSIQSESN